MRVSGNIMPGYRVYEYLLVLHPHRELGEKIMQVKKEFYDAYGAASALQGKPHIAMVNFLQYEMMEQRLLNRLRIIAMGCHPIKVELKDFGSFPSHTIFINVLSKTPIQQLVKTIRHDAQKLMKLNNDNKPHFILEPHLTVARRLLPWQYEQGWQQYSHKHFTGRFIAGSMLLLKRPPGERSYSIAAQYQFQNMPVSTRQGELMF